MAYAGTTAASSAANPPMELVSGIWGKRTTDSVGSTELTGRKVWFYWSTDSTTEPFTANYFTDAQQLGMSPGDALFLFGDTGSTIGVKVTVVGQVSSAGAAALSTGSMISSTFV